jgi:amino acid permease
MFAVVWHYWIGVAVFIPAMLTMFALIAQYLRKTQSPKYPHVKE